MEVLQYTILGFSLKFWIIWTILNAIPGWWLVYKKRNWKRPEAANDPKYRPFHSIDDPYKNYSYLWCLPLFMFSIPRFLIGWCFFSIGPVVAIILNIGEKPHPEGLLPPLKTKIL